jgi:hypothetical protein
MAGVETPRDGAPIYGVHIYFFGGGERSETFTNERAFSRATEFFEGMCADPSVNDNWMTRNSHFGDGQKPVDRRGRRVPGGELERIPFNADLPDPTGEEGFPGDELPHA